LVFEHLGGQPVDVGRAWIDARIEQADHGLFDATVRVQRQHREADDAGAAGLEAGGLDVDDGPSRAWLGNRPTPGRHRRAVPHEPRISRRADITGSLHTVSPTFLTRATRFARKST